jgi:hypothetical protein
MNRSLFCKKQSLSRTVDKSPVPLWTRPPPTPLTLAIKLSDKIKVSMAEPSADRHSPSIFFSAEATCLVIAILTCACAPRIRHIYGSYNSANLQLTASTNSLQNSGASTLLQSTHFSLSNAKFGQPISSGVLLAGHFTLGPTGAAP